MAEAVQQLQRHRFIRQSAGIACTATQLLAQQDGLQLASFAEIRSADYTAGTVVAQNPVMRLMPKVMAVLDSGGSPIKPPRMIDRASIKRTLEQGSVAIDPSEYFL